VYYVVTARDDSHKTYTVTVSVDKAPAPPVDVPKVTTTPKVTASTKNPAKGKGSTVDTSDDVELPPTGDSRTSVLQVALLLVGAGGALVALVRRKWALS
jgi:hypothetical protein